MEHVRKVIPWIGMLLFGALLVAHLVGWEQIRIDTTALLLLAGFLLIPFLEFVRKIKIGAVEAEIAPREVEEAVTSAERELGTEEAEQPPPGKRESDIIQLVREDPRLGLAKLRLEIEQRLKSLDRVGRPQEKRRRRIGLGGLVRELESSDRLPHELASAIRDVLPLANRAVHGEHVRREDAEELAYLGVRILEGLKWVYADQVSATVESSLITRADMQSLMNARYRVETVVPLVENPRRQVRILDQEALTELLEGYDEYAEFLVRIERVDDY